MDELAAHAVKAFRVATGAKGEPAQLPLITLSTAPNDTKGRGRRFQIGILIHKHQRNLADE